MFVEDRSYAKKLFSMAVIGGTISSKDGKIVFTPKDGGADVVLCSIPKDGASITSVTNTYNTITMELSDGTSKTWNINNGKNAKVTAEQDAEHYKTKINMEYYEPDDTKKTEEVFIPHSAIKVEEGEDFSETNRTYKISCYNGSSTPTITTTPNLAPYNLLSGTELSGKEDIVKVVSDSRVGDTYLNTEECTYYKRTDKGGVANTWEFITSLQGKQGISNYEDWITLPEHAGKTKTQYFEWLKNESNQVQKVWDKPTLEQADLGVVYYYKADSGTAPAGQHDAWCYKLNMPNDINYPTGDYYFRIGLQTYKVSTTKVCPALDEKDIADYYVVYNEKTLHMSQYRVLKADGSVTITDESDMTPNPTVPEGTDVTTPDFTELGKWRTVTYVGESKETAWEVDSGGGDISFDNIVKTVDFDQIIGTKDISSKFKTTTVKEQLEEVTDLIRSSKESSLSTTSQNVVGAVNELYDELVGEMGKKANTTDLTNHTSDTDIHISSTERTKWDKVTDKVDKTDITTTIDENSTDTQIASAKSVFQFVSNGKNKLETAITDKGGIVSKTGNVITFDELASSIKSLNVKSGFGNVTNYVNNSSLTTLDGVTAWVSNTQISLSDDYYLNGRVCKVSSTYSNTLEGGRATYLVSLTPILNVSNIGETTRLIGSCWVKPSTFTYNNSNLKFGAILRYKVKDSSSWSYTSVGVTKFTNIDMTKDEWQRSYAIFNISNINVSNIESIRLMFGYINNGSTTATYNFSGEFKIALPSLITVSSIESLPNDKTEIELLQELINN